MRLPRKPRSIRPWEDGADIFVGAGTMCGICDRLGLKRVHIHTNEEAVEVAMKEALNAARTIRQERAKSDIIEAMLNHSEEGVLAISDRGRILAINNQAYRIFQISTVDSLVGSPAQSWSRQMTGKIFCMKIRRASAS